MLMILYWLCWTQHPTKTTSVDPKDGVIRKCRGTEDRSDRWRFGRSGIGSQATRPDIDRLMVDSSLEQGESTSRHNGPNRVDRVCVARGETRVAEGLKPPTFQFRATRRPRVEFVPSSHRAPRRHLFSHPLGNFGGPQDVRRQMALQRFRVRSANPGPG